MYTVKNVKTFRGREGQGFNADLYFNGRKVAQVDDSANGGCYRFYWCDKDREQARADEAALEAHVKTLPPLEINGSPFDMDADLFVSELVEDVTLTKQIAGWVKRSVAFIEGKNIRRTKIAPTATLIETVKRQYPAAIILNELSPTEALAAVKKVAA